MQENMVKSYIGKECMAPMANQTGQQTLLTVMKHVDVCICVGGAAHSSIIKFLCELVCEFLFF